MYYWVLSIAGFNKDSWYEVGVQTNWGLVIVGQVVVWNWNISSSRLIPDLFDFLNRTKTMDVFFGIRIASECFEMVDDILKKTMI